MACSDYTRLKNVQSLRDSGLLNILESNIKSFLEYGLLAIGGWNDVTIPTSGAYGGTFDRLHYVDDPLYTKGQVWETPRLDLVYETGVAFEGQHPIAISGVWIDGSYYSPSHPTYGHHVNYPLGRIVFNSPISTSKAVRLNYSYRQVQVQLADASDIWKEIQYGSLRVEDPQLATPKEGESTAKPSYGRSQLPLIVIEAVPRGSASPTELGSGNLHINQDVLLHVVSENRFWRNRLVSLLQAQQEKVIILADTDSIALSGASPLDYRGSINPTGLTYPQLANETGPFARKHASFERVTTSEIESLNPHLFEGVVRVSVRTAFGGDT